jgi:threonyl-tRNA synthetase
LPVRIGAVTRKTKCLNAFMELLSQAKELEEYLFMLEEAKKRDHRKLGKELELFAFSEKVGNGFAVMVT